MKTPQELLAERVRRIRTAVALGKPDRVPVTLACDAFCAQHVGISIAEYIKDINKSSEYIFQSITALGEVDAVGMTQTTAYAFGGLMLADVKLPGRELPDDQPYQVDEKYLMTVEDYDTIIAKGYNAFCQDYLTTRLPKAGADFHKFMTTTDFAANTMRFVNAGILPFCSGLFVPAFDVFCSARGLSTFMKDLFKIPDKVQAAIDVAMIDMTAALRRQIREAQPLTVFVGFSRGASEFVSPKIWNRFTLPYVKQIVDLIIDEGSVPYLHFDGNWERDLARFKELPKGKCIFGGDSATNLFKAKEVLGDHMCILGDVPPSMLTLGTADEVYAYCRKLINEIGPAGFILAAGCMVPSNAKIANVKAMLSAITGK